MPLQLNLLPNPLTGTCTSTPRTNSVLLTPILMSQWLLTILADGRYLSEDDCIHALLYTSFGNQRNEWVLQIAAPAPNRLILSMTSRSRSSVSGPLPTTTPCPYLPRTELLSITRTMSSSHAAANRFLSVCATTTDDTAFPLSSKQGNGNHEPN